MHSNCRVLEMSSERTGESRYSFEECEAIGKEMIDALKSALKNSDPKIVEQFNAKTASDPRVMAWKYLEERHVLRVLEVG